MSTLSIRALRARLATVVRQAAGGERLVITVAGRPTAQLGPIDDRAPELDQLVANGAVIPPRRASAWRAHEPVAVWTGVRIDRALAELRG